MDSLVNKIVISALLLTTFNDFIQGSVTDILAPIYNRILPGDISKPVNLFGIRFYFTRFIVRIINVYVALVIVNKMTTGSFSLLNPLNSTKNTVNASIKTTK